MPFLFFEISMPYFMRSLAQKVPLTGTVEAGAASMTVVQKMHQEFLQNFRAAGLSHVGMTLPYGELLVTGFLLDKGSSSLGTGVSAGVERMQDRTSSH